MRLEKLKAQRQAQEKTPRTSNRFADLFDAPELTSPPAKEEPAPALKAEPALPELAKPEWSFFKLSHCVCGRLDTCATADAQNWYCALCRSAIEAGKTISPAQRRGQGS